MWTGHLALILAFSLAKNAASDDYTLGPTGNSWDNKCCRDCQQSILSSMSGNTFLSLTKCMDKGCEYPCGVGYEKKYECNGIYVNGVYNNMCQPCAAGWSRTDIATQSACVRNFPTCVAGSTYLSGYDCLTCASCPNTQYWTTDCTTTTNRVCANCPDYRIARGDNRAACEICPSGRYAVFTPVMKCAECASASCASGQYINCYNNADGGQRSCEACNGHATTGTTACGTGYGVSALCSGTATANPTCTMCAEGTNRPAGTALVNGIQICLRCATGTYKAGQNANDCGACTNKPALNSTYDVWPANTVPNSNSCPWVCNAGYYKSGSACIACPTGQYSAASATACSPCNTKPTNSYYLIRSDGWPSTTNACPWDCNAGFVRSVLGTACVACGSNSYRDSSLNRVQDTGAINKCYQCSTCLGTEYVSSACITTQNTVCSSCSTSCPVGFYKNQSCTLTENRQCKACVARCPEGKYLSSIRACSGATSNDEVLDNCLACQTTSDCQTGFYLSGNCSGTEFVSNRCIQCSSGNCGPSQYRGYCGGFTDTVCTEFRVCQAGQYLAGESKDQDGTCMNCSTCTSGVVRPCTRYEDTVCGGSPCSASVSCNRRSSVSRLSTFCDYSRGIGFASCGVCPHGYGSDGQFCQECPRGFTCDVRGAVACKGQCKQGILSSCESQWDLGYVACDTSCSIQTVQSQIPWRGSYTDYEGTNCAAVFFRCNTGYYKLFGTGGTVGCEPCNEARPTGGIRDRWVTEGLSVGDATSCIWECKRELAVWSGTTCALLSGREQRGGWNSAGAWAGVGGSGTCRVGFTSEAGTAMVLGECLACPPLDAQEQRLKTVTGQCEWECIRYGAVKIGGKCVQPRSDCLTTGVSELGGVCLVTSYPWNRPGYVKTGWGVPVVSQYSGGWDSTAPITFASLNYGVVNRHTLVLTGGGLVRNTPGRMCSGVLGSWNGRTYAFGALCNQSFLVYLDLSVTNSKMGVLIGNSTRGYRDGFRTQALFEDELYVASNGNDGRLFVLDRWNCLLREVVVWDEPGKYRNRVFTVWGVASETGPRCFGTGALAWPRRFWDLPGDWLAFADEDGLWQFNTETRELGRMVRESDGSFEADDLVFLEVTGDAFTLVLWFKGGVKWTVTAAQEACPVDWTSLAGGGCSVECRRSNQRFVDPSTGECRPCVSPVCGVGQTEVACTGGRDAYCEACPAVVGLAYTQAGSCEGTTRRPVPPCNAGWYRVSNGLYCNLCPAYTSTRLSGATRIEQCKCVDGLVRREGACVGEDLYDFEENRMCAASCQIPSNARLVKAETCLWECNAGYYRDTMAGYLEQCRLCRLAGARTRGDDDQPWSCE